MPNLTRFWFNYVGLFCIRALSTQPMPGCIFEYFGRIPESVYAAPKEFHNPLEQAVFNNDVELFNRVTKEGTDQVSIRLMIGEMTCLEYAAMKGHVEILRSLVEKSICRGILEEYFAFDEMVDRAWLLSSHKEKFFDDHALAEANRYVSALYTAVVFDQSACLSFMLSLVKPRDISAHMFYHPGDESTRTEMNACELAKRLGHADCVTALSEWSLAIGASTMCAVLSNENEVTANKEKSASPSENKS